MSRQKLIWLFLAALPLWPQSGASAEGDIRALAVHVERPSYPYEARARHLQGSGIAILTVDPATGNVTTVKMRASTGFNVLDDAAISAFRHREQSKSSGYLQLLEAWR